MLDLTRVLVTSGGPEASAPWSDIRVPYAQKLIIVNRFRDLLTKPDRKLICQASQAEIAKQVEVQRVGETAAFLLWGDLYGIRFYPDTMALCIAHRNRADDEAVIDLALDHGHPGVTKALVDHFRKEMLAPGKPMLVSAHWPVKRPTLDRLGAIHTFCFGEAFFESLGGVPTAPAGADVPEPMRSDPSPADPRDDESFPAPVHVPLATRKAITEMLAEELDFERPGAWQSLSIEGQPAYSVAVDCFGEGAAILWVCPGAESQPKECFAMAIGLRGADPMAEVALFEYLHARERQGMAVPQGWHGMIEARRPTTRTCLEYSARGAEPTLGIVCDCFYRALGIGTDIT